ncbi:DISEASE RESISTANCE PROTEIN RP [Salix purpurea]|uniref:DISEASE RESISTANCE PROTEIN RP n=1 Tax=Salix purpurea TaxID=77065 RepID=A0A9Q0ZI85_SALPP|nr:DISEASE RESISTANCE PROTEIN RP [Salix purpurea]
MHDLTNDLAKFVYGEFAVCLDDGDSWKVSKMTRHLSYARTRSEGLNRLMGFDEVPNLRRILLISRLFLANMSGEEIGDFLRRFQRLSVLSLLRGGKLPNSISNFKQLWYLNLSGSSKHRLPETLCTLRNLQILILRGCNNLIELPTNLMKLTNLQNGSSIKELGELKCLEGKLRIWMLQKVDDAQDALGANLEGMRDLKKFDLRWSDDAYGSLDERVFHQLKPHVNVCCLVIVGYGGSRILTWCFPVKHFPKLKQLDISGCSNLESLCLSDGAGEWSNLEDLSLFDCSNLKSVNCSLPSLVTLKLSRCGELESFLALGLPSSPGVCLSSKLESLTIHDCQKLFARLKDLDFDGFFLHVVKCVE